MENASKALIIAGSVLIVILLIAMGMRIFTSTSGTTEQVEETMTQTEIATFNSKFLPYVGRNKSKSDLMALANLMIANNATNDHKIYFKISSALYNPAGRINEIASVSDVRLFYITAYYDSNGLIYGIHYY